ncbi:MAG: hypothetical protein QM758_00560 [Armatimonas sp.]
MKRANLCAASVLLLAFGGLALLPLTRSVVRSDARMASGETGLGATLQDLGLRKEDLPLGGIGPMPSRANLRDPAPGSELEVRLANAVQLESPQKWAALQQLVKDFPDQPAAHAALVRFACKNGGSVGIGRSEQQERLSPPKPQQATNYTHVGPNPQDIALMVTSGEAGERLDPGNAYFSAMTAIAYFAAEEDGKAQAALHRAAEKKIWREYIDVELKGHELRAERLGRTGNSLARTARMASILFPHYAQLRAMSRIATVQAMDKEVAGDIKGGLEIRRDTKAVGKIMRLQGSSLITNLVGMAMERIAMSRPGGAPATKAEEREESDSRFISWLDKHTTSEEAQAWKQDLPKQNAVKEIASKGGAFSIFGSGGMAETVFRSVAGMVLLSAVVLLCLLSGLSFGKRVLGRTGSHTGMAVSVVAFLGVLSWLTWNMLGGVRDALAMNSLIQGLSGGEGTGLPPTIIAALWREGVLMGVTALALPIGLFFVAVLGSRPGKPSRGGILRHYALPLAAVFAVIYAVHTISFGMREKAVHAELSQMSAHEGRYLAGKLGRTWPE